MQPDEAGLRDFGALATGELSARDTLELESLKRRIEDLAGFCCDGYKERCLRRRIAVRMRARQVHAYADYASLLESDPVECRRLVDAVTINVSKFFRNSEVWSLIEREVLPELMRLDEPRINVWSAGCAAGEEIYTLAILLLEFAEREQIEVQRFHLLGTDIDEKALADARRGSYGTFSLSETPAAVRQRWFEGPEHTRVRREVRELVRFEPLDLIAGSYPGDQHLIFCRNVVIYFERHVQESVFRRFQAALQPGGFLLLGKVEALFGEQLRSFTMVSGRDRLFRKP